MQKLVNTTDKTLSVFSCLFFAGFIIVVLIQVFSRTFLPKTPAWTEELARYCFIYAIACTAGLAVRREAFVAVDVFTGFLPEKLKRYHKIFINTLLLLFTLFFEIFSVFKFAFLKNRMVSTALEIPMQIVYFAMVILFFMLSLSYLFEIIMLIKNNKEEILQIEEENII